MKILIVGGGFIAQSIIAYTMRFKSTSIDICLLVRSKKNLRPGLIDGVKCVYIADATDKNAIENILYLERIEFVLVLAGCTTVPAARSHPNQAYRTNIDIVSAVCEACTGYANIRGILLASTSSVYSAALSRNVPFTEETTIEAKLLLFSSTYVRSKFCAEISTQDFPRLPIVILRLANLYGPLDRKERLIPLTIQRLLNNEAPVVFIDEKTGKAANLDFLYIDDCCSAIYHILERLSSSQGGLSAFPKIVNVGTGQVCSTQDIVQSLLTIMDVKVEPVFIRKEGIDYSYPGMNVLRIKNDYGFVATTSIYEGLRLTCDAWVSKSA